MRQDQRHWLLRLRLRRHEGSIERPAADALARACWDALHEGSSLAHRPGA